VRQDDDCKTFLCTTTIQEEIDACQFACSQKPGYLRVDAGINDLDCLCIWNHNTLCQSSNPFTPFTNSRDMTGLRQGLVLVVEVYEDLSI
jgi:hypothetical protein